MNSDPTRSPLHSRPIALFSLRSLLLGLVPMLALLWLLVGSLTNAMTIIAASIVCTLGIGAAFWVGIAMLLGAALQVLLPSLRGRTRPPAETDAAVAVGKLTPLVDYACFQLRIGSSEERVRLNLDRAGWGEQQIATVLAEARGLLATMDGDGAGSDPDAR